MVMMLIMTNDNDNSNSKMAEADNDVILSPLNDKLIEQVQIYSDKLEEVKNNIIK